MVAQGAMPDASIMLNYRQRLALLRHNLHTASLTRSFTFFQMLQTSSFVSRVNQISALYTAISSTPLLTASPTSPTSRRESTSSTCSNALPVAKAFSQDPSDLSDTLVASLDKLACIIAHVHEDAFRSLTEFIAQTPHDDFAQSQHLIRAEADFQRTSASKSIDKMFDQALALISLQNSTAVREAAADVFAVAITFVTDAVAICLREMDRVEGGVWDRRRLEESKERVGQAVVSAVSALKGVYGLMGEESQTSCSTINSPLSPSAKAKPLSPDVGGGARGWVRRMSAALTSSNMAVSENISSVTRGRRESVNTVTVIQSQTEPGPGLRSSASMTRLSSHVRQEAASPAAAMHSNFHLDQQGQGIIWGESPFTPSWRKKAGMNQSSSSGSVPIGKVPMRSGIANKLAEIPPTPAEAGENINPFDRDGWKHLSGDTNESAFATNRTLSALADASEDLDPGHDPLDPVAARTDHVGFDGWAKNAPNPATVSIDAH